MSLRDEIIEILNDPGAMRRATTRTADFILAAVGYSETPRASTPIKHPRGIEQGVTELAFLAFVRGLDGPWNGSRVVGRERDAWIRYRGHQIDRELTPDGLVIRVAHLDHLGASVTATYPVQPHVEDPVAAQWVTDLIDGLLDAVIDQHGVPGDEIPDAEVVELVDGATARRVIESWWAWNKRNTEDVQNYDPATAVDRFAIAINAGEVTP